MNAHSLTSSLLDEVGNDHISQTHLAELGKRYPYFIVPKVCYALHEKNPQKLWQELAGYNVNPVRYSLLHYNTLHLKPSFIDIELTEQEGDGLDFATKPVSEIANSIKKVASDQSENEGVIGFKDSQARNEESDHNSLEHPAAVKIENLLKDKGLSNSVLELPELISPTADFFTKSDFKDIAAEVISENNLLTADEVNEDKFLLVQMSFDEWLQHITKKNSAAKEEAQEQKHLKWQWQHQKLAAAIQEEGDEIPEDVFKMAIDSIAAEEDIASESMAKVYLGQGKGNKAIDIYRKLILQNPEKKVYFADQIEQIQKDLQK